MRGNTETPAMDAAGAVDAQNAVSHSDHSPRLHQSGGGQF
jgi:hypothetical protein